ncbi:MAG: ABC transporter ATP-binding protein [Lewinellaceae bacterium]|nr:ABC transporter ATP-binding protein [Lewinellaceae bacterium]
MIIAEQLVKSYGDVRVLKGVDLHIEPAEIVSITGKSGAGKSTLLHILGMLDNADSGKVIINGTETNSMDEKQSAKFRNENIGFVFQFHHLLGEFTALENVCIPAYISKKDTNEVDRKAKELLHHLGLSHRNTHKPNQLSGGEAQRVAVARALINNPKVIFADEPTGNLDRSSSENLHNLFLELRKELGISFVIVTHNEELAKISDRIIHIDDGVIV